MKTILSLVLSAAVLLLNGCATMRRHPKLTSVGIVVGTGLLTYALMPKQPHCDKYPPGYSGVNVPCPKPDSTPEGRKK